MSVTVGLIFKSNSSIKSTDCLGRLQWVGMPFVESRDGHSKLGILQVQDQVQAQDAESGRANRVHPSLAFHSDLLSIMIKAVRNCGDDWNSISAHSAPGALNTLSVHSSCCLTTHLLHFLWRKASCFSFQRRKEVNL